MVIPLSSSLLWPWTVHECLTTYHLPVPVPERDMAIEHRNENSNNNAVYFGRTPDEWITHTNFLVNEGLKMSKGE